MDKTRRARPVRVCFVIENLLAAGTELWVVRLIERLDRQRVAPYLCLTDGRGDASRRLEPASCPVLRLGLEDLKSVRSLSAIVKLGRFLRRHQMDIVQVHHADPSYLAVPAARLFGVPTVVQTKFDIGYWLTDMDLRLHRGLRRWVDVTIANCLACRQAAIEQERAPPKSIVVIENGIETERFRSLDELRLNNWHTPVQIGMIANLRPIKDPECLLQAARRLLKDGVPVEFQVAGDGPLYPALSATIEREGWGGQFNLLGYVANTTSFFERVQICVLCSRSEGLPHVLVEAMAAGRAVIATDVGGNRELIRHGETGLLIPPGDPLALADAIRQLVDRPETAVQLGQAARQSVAGRFCVEAMMRGFTEFYHSLWRHPPRQGEWRFAPNGLPSSERSLVEGAIESIT